MAAAFVVPGFVLRDTDVLTIPRQDLARLTPVADEEIKRRQAIARDAGEIAPDVGLALFIFGVVLLSLGVPRLRQQEQGDDERRRIELDKLRAEMRPQSSEEREERLRDDVREEELEESSAALRGKPRTSLQESRRRLAERLKEAADAEDAVLTRLAEIAPPVYDFESRVAVHAGEHTLLLDGLFISQIDQLPDIVVEIKYVPARTIEIGRRLREGKLQLLRQLARYNRTSIGWLIVVAGAKLDQGKRKELEKGVATDSDALRLSVVRVDEVDQLRIPI